MQFYALFPFLMIWIRRRGWLVGAVTICVVFILCGLATRHFFPFPMPSFLALKLHIFMVGMLIAGSMTLKPAAQIPMLLLALALAIVPLGGSTDATSIVARLLIAAFLVTLTVSQHLPTFISALFRGLEALLSSTPLRLAGELSYGAYLWHLLVLIPIASLVLSQLGTGGSGGVRLALASVVTLPLVYALSYVTYRLIEIPAQNFGRSLSAKKTVISVPITREI